LFSRVESGCEPELEELEDWAVSEGASSAVASRTAAGVM
jgi:hypothetical protein